MPRREAHAAMSCRLMALVREQVGRAGEGRDTHRRETPRIFVMVGGRAAVVERQQHDDLHARCLERPDPLQHPGAVAPFV